MIKRFKVISEAGNKQNNIELRKLLINEKMNQFYNEEISLEGFFDSLFGKKKEVEVKRNLDIILTYVRNNKNIKLKSHFKNFNDYMKVLEDLIENVLTDVDADIDRVTKFLNFFLQHKEKVINFKSELEKLGSFDISTIKIKNNVVYKSKCYSSTVTSHNGGLDHLDIDFKKLSSKQLDFLKFPEYLFDIDILINASVVTSEKTEISLDESQRNTLEEVLIKLQKKLPLIKSKTIKLKELFQKSEKIYIEILKSISLPQEVVEDEYVGFGGSMYQGLGYLYEIEYGIEDDLDKQVK